MRREMKFKGLRWLIVGMVGLATVINYIDRNALAVMWPQISKDMGVGKEAYALILTCFMLSYAAGQTIFGKIFDALGTRVGFMLSILAWSASIALHSVARSILTLGVLRAALGVSEAGNWPGAAKANAEWFPVRERAFAQGIFNAGASVGAIISAPLIAWLFLTFGWRATFMVIGLLGVLWVVPWAIVCRAAPQDHPWLSDEERQHILTGQRPASGDAEADYKPTWSGLLRHREAWGLILARFFIDPVWWLFVSWLPIYLAERFGFDIKQIGLFGWVPYVGAAAGSLFGGWISGWLIGRGWRPVKARKWAITLGGVFMLPALLLTIGASSPLHAVLLIAVILFGFQVTINNIQTLPSDYLPRSVGSLAGISGTAAVAGVLITTWIVPVATKVSYAPVFAMGASLVPLSILSIWLLGGRGERLVDPALAARTSNGANS
jgi:ACS family hexuronate transporter-like MFS transporter